MERDEKGRFLPGNQAAVGNRGNRKPKYRNKNALKHGFHETLIYPTTLDDDSIVLVKGNGRGISMLRMNPDYCYVDDDGKYWFHVKLKKALEDIGWYRK